MLSFIYEHFSEDIALANIACIAHISIGECCRIFREHLQTTPYQFLTEYRIRKSVELLSGELSISEIAGRCGYNRQVIILQSSNLLWIVRRHNIVNIESKKNKKSEQILMGLL